jgi:hypothetical protein
MAHNHSTAGKKVSLYGANAEEDDFSDLIMDFTSMQWSGCHLFSCGDVIYWLRFNATAMSCDIHFMTEIFLWKNSLSKIVTSHKLGVL